MINILKKNMSDKQATYCRHRCIYYVVLKQDVANQWINVNFIITSGMSTCLNMVSADFRGTSSSKVTRVKQTTAHIKVVVYDMYICVDMCLHRYTYHIQN